MCPQIFFACIVTQAVGDNTWAYFFGKNCQDQSKQRVSAHTFAGPKVASLGSKRDNWLREIHSIQIFPTWGTHYVKERLDDIRGCLILLQVYMYERKWSAHTRIHTHRQTELHLCAECLPVLATVFSLKAVRRQSWIASCACLPTCHRHPVRLMWLHTAFFWQVPWAGDAVRFYSKLDKSSQIKGISAWWKIGPKKLGFQWLEIHGNSLMGSCVLRLLQVSLRSCELHGWAIWKVPHCSFLTASSSFSNPFFTGWCASTRAQYLQGRDCILARMDHCMSLSLCPVRGFLVCDVKGLGPASLWWCRLEMPTLPEWLSHIWLKSTLQWEWWNLAWPWSRHDVVLPVSSPFYRNSRPKRGWAGSRQRPSGPRGSDKKMNIRMQMSDVVLDGSSVPG